MCVQKKVSTRNFALDDDVRKKVHSLIVVTPKFSPLLLQSLEIMAHTAKQRKAAVQNFLAFQIVILHQEHQLINFLSKNEKKSLVAEKSADSARLKPSDFLSTAVVVKKLIYFS